MLRNLKQTSDMSIDKFSSFSYTKRPTRKPYFLHDKPFRFMEITKNNTSLNYYKTRNQPFRSIIAGSSEPHPKPLIIHKPKPKHKDSSINANTSVHEGLTLGAQSEKPVMDKKLTQDSNNGIGITKFIGGKSYFVTGATGFLSKVFVEKLLAMAPDIRRIYLLIRGRDREDAKKRLKTEIIDSELFKNLKELYGSSFEEFVMNKIVPVVGNVCEPNLGLQSDIAYEIAKEVDVIVNSAAITSFDERYDVALEVNTKGPCQLICFAKKCKKLQILLHFSTAFANRDKNGAIYEETLCFESSRAHGNERGGNEQKTISEIDIEDEIELALNSLESFEAQNVVPKLKELGLERARFYGWPNTYSATKAMGEMYLNDRRGDVPLVIIRPSIIESTYKKPFPGWIQGNRVLDPLIIHYGKGQLQGTLADPDAYLNIVPADMVVNASLAAMAKHGIESTPGIHVYHVTSSVTKPFLIRSFYNFIYDYFLANPFRNSEGDRICISEMKYFSQMDEYSAFLLSGKNVEEMTKWKRKTNPLLHMSKIYQPYMFYKGSLQSSNIKKLMEYMCEKEKEDYDIDFEGIDWKDYFLKVHIPGVKKHVLKGREIVQNV